MQINDPERNFHCFYQLCASGKVPLPTIAIPYLAHYYVHNCVSSITARFDYGLSVKSALNVEEYA